MKKPNVLWIGVCLAAALFGWSMSAHAATGFGSALADIAAGPVAGSPARNVSPTAQAANPAVSLEEAIKAAKGKITVPAELDKFSSDYRESNGKGLWNLRWYSSNPPDSSMSAVVNAVTGEVESVSYYRGVTPGARYKGLPAYSREQCMDIARRAAERMEPEKYAQTVAVPVEDYPIQPLYQERDYPVTYSFSFKRAAGGIIVSDQWINVTVNADTGEVTGYNSSWLSGISLPSAANRVTSDQAQKIFMEKAGYELTYFMVREDDPDILSQIKLVYRQKTPGRFYLNAVTGEIIDTTMLDFYSYDMMGGGGGDGRNAYKEAAAVPLTPAENRAVKETKDMISADKAQEAAARAVDIPEGYAVKNRSLDRNYNVPGSRIWHIQYADDKDSNWISVSVDARTGELVSFSRDKDFDAQDYYREPQNVISADEAKKIAESFIGKMQPGKSGQVVFRQCSPQIGPWVKEASAAPKPQSYTLDYARLVDGVLFPENGFNIRVDAVSGEVLSYRMSWLETSFPKTDGVIGAQAANGKYLSAYPLVLEYGRGYNPWKGMGEDAAYYLYYRQAGRQEVLIDAMSGQEIDYQGNPVTKKGSQAFSDISGHPAENDIMTLAGQGIIVGDGGKFRPDDGAKTAEVLAMLVKAYSRQGGYYPVAVSKDAPWYKQIFETARAMGILDEGYDADPDAFLDRIGLARLGINAGGWGKVARLSRIFNLNVADAAGISGDNRGYAAIALEMGLITPQEGGFNPHGMVTRGQAASFIVKLLKQ